MNPPGRWSRQTKVIDEFETGRVPGLQPLLPERHPLLDIGKYREVHIEIFEQHRQSAAQAVRSTIATTRLRKVRQRL